MIRRKLRLFLLAVAVVGGVTVVARLLGYKLWGNVVVRCRQGHLYTTLWIPGVRLKSFDFLVARFQYCPVGKHWSLALPVRERDLTDEQRADAAAHRDRRIP